MGSEKRSWWCQFLEYKCERKRACEVGHPGPVQARLPEMALCVSPVIQVRSQDRELPKVFGWVDVL